MSAHGGNLRALAARARRPVEDLLDFSANVNPLGFPDCVRPAVSRSLDRVVHYPDPEATELVAAIAARYGLPAETIVVANGSSEILFALAHGLGRPRAVIPVPSYVDYATSAGLSGAEVETLPLRESDGFALDWDALAAALRGDETVFLGQPNNPTGLLFDADAFRRFAALHPATLFVVDEAFADFIDGYESLAANVAPNVVVLKSLTKFYAVPGLRLGFAAAPADLAAQIRRHVPPWSVNTLAQAVGVAMLADEDYAARTRAYVREQRETLVRELSRLPGLHIYPGAANFLLVRLTQPEASAAALADRLLKNGIAIRTFTPDQHLDDRFFRIAVRTGEENARLIAALTEAGAGAFSRPLANPPRRAAVAPAAKRAAALMFQGTSSNAGKSVLTAALCRILLQDGLRVAPFKSQNMSLNSFVTHDGGEMGRAQVVQAQACRLEPDIRMNPVLLKPNSDTGSQVIVRGRPVGNMHVAEYVDYKPRAWAAAAECYDSLAAEFDAVVLEGAGSPGEVNLKHHDIVNMRMAAHAGAPVLVVGDIDRGGVFASFVGTMEVLAAWERALVAGWVVNRFRGDAGLLGPALDYTLRHTGRPVFGVVPYLPSLGLPQEDSVEFKSGALDAARGPDAADDAAAVEVAVIDLPHISNFTDFDAFAAEPDVRLRIVRSAADLDSPDALVLPGSKNTLGDMEYLNRSGLAAKIAALAAAGCTEIVGICGGFQMLGREIRDPASVESAGGRARGLGLLHVDTIMAVEKTLVRTTAQHGPSGLSVTGYEIHHGQTEAGPHEAVFTRADGRPLGVAATGGLIWGTYLHGVFDADAFRRWFIDRLRSRRGLPPLGAGIGATYDIEPALDRLAAVVRQSLDMKAIYRLMGI